MNRSVGLAAACLVAATLSAAAAEAQIPEGRASAICQVRTADGSLVSGVSRTITIEPRRAFLSDNRSARLRFLGLQPDRIMGMREHPRDSAFNSLMHVWFEVSVDGRLSITRWAERLESGGPVFNSGGCLPAE